MDEIDFKLLRILAKNSRESFRNIAKELDISTDTVSKRYHKLKECGVVKTSVIVDLIQLGYNAHSWYWISISSTAQLSCIVDKLSKIPDVISIDVVTGDCDLIVVAAIRDFRHLQKLDQKIIAIEGITRIDSSQTVLDDQNSFYPLLDKSIL
ncbi:MAG: Lrp/AsnC family transcriptional regulator [Candidatus Bathyarchaeota archaeon]|nr:Lrp/AsnC family transcriptional regulator [Candidatus Bathyarchaeum sp.]